MAASSVSEENKDEEEETALSSEELDGVLEDAMEEAPDIHDGSAVDKDPLDLKESLSQKENFFSESSGEDKEIALSTTELDEVLKDFVEEDPAAELPSNDVDAPEKETSLKEISSEQDQTKMEEVILPKEMLAETPKDELSPETISEGKAPPVENSQADLGLDIPFEEISESSKAGAEDSPLEEVPTKSGSAFQNEDFFKENNNKENEEITLSTEELDQVLEDAVEHPNVVDEQRIPTLDELQPELSTQEEIISDEFFKNLPVKDAPPEDTLTENISGPSPGDAPSTLEVPDKETIGPLTDAPSENIEREDLKKVISYLDTLLGELPDHVIKDFARSDYFSLYKKVMDRLGV